MKHISIFDGCTYEISYSMSMENGKQYDDNITIIWRDALTDPNEANGVDLPIREFIGWYCGEYDYEDTEWFIKDWYRKKLEAKPIPKKPKTMDLPICYVHLIQDCLTTIQDHNLYELIDSYDKDEESIEALKGHIEDVLCYFCGPLDKLDIDTEIIIEEDK